MKTKQISGDFKNCSGRYALVAGRFNQFITERLIQGATDTLTRHGINSTDIDCIWVPGAFEIPLLARKLVKTGNYAAIITLGAVIRGATAHFDFVAGACANGIAELSLHSNIPVIFGVLTTDTVEQAIERSGADNDTLLSPDKTIEQATELTGSKSGNKAGNKGADCALAALEMVSLLKQL